MMTFEEAINKIANKININTESINHEDVVDLISDIYDSIGSCGKCKHGFIEDKYNDYYVKCNISHGKIPHTQNWYCADFKSKEQ
jgi:hypothetical protein